MSEFDRDSYEEFLSEQKNTPVEGCRVHPDTIPLLASFLRIRLRHFSDAVDYAPESITETLDYEEINPSTLQILKSTHPENSDQYRVICVREKNPEDEKYRKVPLLQNVVLHPEVTVASDTFGSVFREILFRLDHSDRPALETFVKEYFEEGLPDKVTITPSRTLESVHNRYPKYTCQIRNVTICDPHMESGTSGKVFEKLDETYDAVQKFLHDGNTYRVLLEYSPTSPDTIQIVQLTFDAAKTMREQLFEDFVIPKNIKIGKGPAGAEQILDDIFCVQGHSKGFRNEDIEFIRKTIVESCEEYSEVYLTIETGKTYGDGILRICGKR